MRVGLSKYQEIAIDIAVKISEGHYVEGQKIYSKSSLSSQYGVSSETSRRAVSVLADRGIVVTTKGSGIVISSKEKAREFVNSSNQIRQINQIKSQIINDVETQIETAENIKKLIDEMMYKTERFKSFNQFLPFDLVITSEANYIGETVSGIELWKNTSATVIAIKRNEQIILSPGPNAVITIDDMIYFIGDDESKNKVKNFFYTD